MKRKTHSILLCGALAALAPFLARPVDAAGDWPEFRGPSGQGHSTERDLPQKWSDTRNVVWKTPLTGNGWSSPALARGKIFLTTAVSETEDDPKSGQSLRALCLDQSGGEVLWDVEVFAQEGGKDAPRVHKKNSHASPTPVIEGDRIFVHFGHQGTACLDLSGKVLWKNREFDYKPVHGNGGSPIVVDNKLIFSCDAADDPFVVALDKNTGKRLWKTPRKTEVERKFSFSTPLLIQVDGARQVVSPGSGAVCAYNPDTGKEIWRVDYDEGYSVVPRPVYGHGLVFVATGFNKPKVMAIRPDGKGDVTETHVAWEVEKAAPHTPSLLLVEDQIYMVSDSGIASCLDAKTGKVRWQERIRGNYSASPVYADRKIYFQDEDGRGVVLQASGSFREIAENDIGEATLASYAIADGALYIRGDKHLYKIGK